MPADLACSICELATLAKMHKHLPGLCKAVVVNLLVMNSSVEAHFKHVACTFCSLLRQCRLLLRFSRERGNTLAVL